MTRVQANKVKENVGCQKKRRRKRKIPAGYHTGVYCSIVGNLPPSTLLTMTINVPSSSLVTKATVGG